MVSVRGKEKRGKEGRVDFGELELRRLASVERKVSHQMSTKLINRSDAVESKGRMLLESDVAFFLSGERGEEDVRLPNWSRLPTAFALSLRNGRYIAEVLSS